MVVESALARACRTLSANYADETYVTTAEPQDRPAFIRGLRRLSRLRRWNLRHDAQGRKISRLLSADYAD
jgi:hypothetical protein